MVKKKGKNAEEAEKAAANELVAEQLPPDVKTVIKSAKKSLKGWKIIVAVLAGLLLVALGSWVWAVIKDKSELTNDEIVVRVSRELQISGDGNPAILTVEDEQKVSQPFLEDAKNGDKVLLYYKAGKSVLFRPSEDKIIRSGTYTVPEAKIFIRKGTADDAKVAAAKDKLKNVKNLRVTSQDNSVKQDYAKTQVIHITDRYDEQTAKVAEALNAQVVRLPRGETIPDADILVIVGSE